MSSILHNPVWRILHIDDDEEDYLITREMLAQSEGRKIQVDYAASYEAGQDKLNDDHYDAVLVDYDLGRRTGIDLIKEYGQAYSAPLILYTGRGNREVDIEAMQAGATLYITKTEANPLLLERAIRYAIELKQRENDLRVAREVAERELADRKQAEKALQESITREKERTAELDAVFEAAPAIIWVTHDTTAENITGNQAAYDFLRVPQGKNLSKSALAIEAPRNFKVYQNGRELAPEELPLQISAATGKPVRGFEEEVVFEDGSHAILFGNVAPLHDAEGKPCGAVAAFVDVTVFKQVEEALKESTEALRASEHKFSTLFQKAAYAAILGSLPDSTVVDVNEAWEKLYGYTRTEAIGKTIPELNLVVDLEQRSRYLSELMEKGFVHDYELLIRVKTGEVRTMRVNFDFLEIGGKKYTLNTSYDITDFKQAEAALRQSEEKYAKSFRSSPAAIAISTAAEGRFTEVNDRFVEIYGYTREEMIGRTSTELGLYENLEDRKEILRLLQQEGRFRDYEIRMRNRNGEPRDLLFSGERVNIDGQDYLLALILDITERQQAEAILKESQSRLIEFVENFNNSYFTLDREWRITYANQFFAEVMSRDRSEIIGRVFWDVFPQYLGTDVEQHYRRVMNERIPFSFRRGGIYSSGLYDISLYPNKEGLASFSVDRTEELRKQQQLEDERARLDTVLQALPVGIWVTDANGKIELKNEQADRIWAGTAPMSESVEQYHEYRSWYADTGEEVPLENYPLAVALRTGQPTEPVEFRIQCFDGTQGVVMVSATPMKDGEGRLIGAVAVNVDIARQKEVEKALQESEREYRELAAALEVERSKLAATIEGLPIGVCVGDLQGNVLSLNRAGLDLHGFRSETELFAHLQNYQQEYQLRYPDGSIIALEDWPANRALRGDYVRDMEVILHNQKSRQEYIIAYNAVPVYNAAGEPILIVYTLQDLSERKQSENELQEYAERLQQSNQALQDFAFIASHDLREPLRKVQAFGRMLEDRFGEEIGVEGKGYIDRMTSAVTRMKSMLDGLLNYSRVTSQAQPLVEVDLNQVVHDVLVDLEARVIQTGGEVKIGKLPTIHADPLQMRQLFQNLIGNALKYHRTNIPPRVTVSARRSSKNRVEIEVKDNGIGFNNKEALHLFQPFTRLHSRSEIEGTGIGLAICKKIVERHGGTIEAESEPGRGSTFKVTLSTKE